MGRWPWKMNPFNPHRDAPPEKVSGIPAVAPRQRLSVAVGLMGVDQRGVVGFELLTAGR